MAADTKVLSNVLLSILTTNEVEKLPADVAKKLEKHLAHLDGEIEKCKFQAELIRVDSEQQYFEVESQFAATKSQLDVTAAENEKLTAKITDLESKWSHSSSELLEVKESHETTLSTKLQLSRANERLQAEKQELVLLLEKKNLEVDKLNEMCKEMSEKVTAANNAKCEAIAKLDEINSQEISLQYKEKRWEQERSLLEQQITFLKQDLSGKDHQLHDLRTESANKILELQHELEEKTEELNLLTESAADLRNTNNETEKRLESLVDKLKDAHSNFSQTEQQFQAELDAQIKLAGLYKNSADESENKVNELGTAVQELQKLLQQATNAHSEIEQRYTDDTNKLQGRLNELQGQVDKLEKELENANDLLAAARQRGVILPMSKEELETEYPTAAATSRVLKSGMTLTQIYSEFVEVSNNLQLEKDENRRLSQYLEQILQEIEEKAPILKKQREDYERALETVTQLTTHQQTTLQEFQKVTVDTDDAKRRCVIAERESTRLKQQTIDLSQQVKTLLQEVEELRGGFITAGEKEENVSDPDVSSSSHVISERLVTFKDIEELQKQNQHLLTVVRELSEKNEENEKTTTNSRIVELQNQLEMTTRDVDELRAARQRQSEMVESIVRQRDMYKVLLGQSGESITVPNDGSPPLLSKSSSATKEAEIQAAKSALEQLQKEFTDYKLQAADVAKHNMEELDKLRSDVSSQRIQNGQLSSQLEFAHERYKILQSNVENYKKEIIALKDKNQKFSSNIIKYQTNVSTLTHEITGTREKLSSAEAEIEGLKAERDILKSGESRLLAEKDALLREQRGQNVLLSNLQNIQNNLERSETETKRRLGNRIEMLERDCTALRHQLDEEIQHNRTANKGWQSQLKQMHDRYEAELEAHQKTRDELVEMSNKNKDLCVELSALKTSLTAAESRLSNAQPAAAVNTSSKTDRTLLEEEVKDLKAQLATLQQENKALHSQLEQARQHARQHRTMAEEIEKSLREQNAASKTLQENLEARFEEARCAIESLEKKTVGLEQERQETIEENIRLNNLCNTQGSDLRKQLFTLQNDLQEAQVKLQNAIANEATAVKDLKEQAQVAAQAQDKYERELLLHAADVESLSTLKVQLESFTGKVNEAEERAKQAEETLSTNQTLWSSQEHALKEESLEYFNRLTELEEQNSVLHSQMQTMSEQLIALQSRSLSTSFDDSMNVSRDDAEKSSEQLLQIIKYLRREKEISVTKCEVATADCLRQKLRVGHLEKQLSETQASLSEERKKTQATLKTASEHAEMMKKVENLNVLTESNRLLREEKERLDQQLQQIKSKVTQLEGDILPLQQNVRELTAEKDAVGAENVLLKSEVQRWQARVNEVLNKPVSKSDTDEYKKLVEDKEKQRKQFMNLIQEQNTKAKEDKEKALQQQATVHNETARKLREEIASLAASLSSTKTELEKYREESVQSVAVVDQLKVEVNKKDEEIQEKAKANNQLKRIGRKYKVQFDELTTEHNKLKEEHEKLAVAQPAGNTDSQSESKVVELQQQIVQLEEKNKAVVEEKEALFAEVETMKKTEEQQNVSITEKENEKEKMKKEIATLKKAEERQSAAMTEKENEKERMKKMLAQARLKINQLIGQRDVTVGELEESKKQYVSLQSTLEEQKLRFASLKSQMDAKIAKLENELKESKDTKQGLESLVERLTREFHQQHSLFAQQTKQMGSGVSGHVERASIKPIATASSSKHAATVTPVSAVTSSAKATPTASIRPMAISSQQTPTATVMPTPSGGEHHEEQQPTTIGISPTPRQATVQPTQQVIPAIIVTPLIEGEELVEEVEETTTEPVSAPQLAGGSEVAEETEEIQQEDATDLPSNVHAATEPVVAGSSAKRSREQFDGGESSVIFATAIPQKRPRAGSFGEQAQARTEERPADPAAATAAVVEQIAVEPDIVETLVTTELAIQREEGFQDVADAEEKQVVDAGDDDVILVESGDEEDQAAEYSDEDNDDEEEEGFGEEEVDADEMRDFDEEISDMAEDYGENEEELEEPESEMVTSGDGDSDVVEVIEDDDDDDDDQEAENDETNQMETQESRMAPPQDTPVVPPVSGTVPQQAAESSEAVRPSFLPRLPMRSERLPSTGARTQATGPFTATAPNYDEGDGIVPSTPTLSVPRRNDGFAEAVSSPQVAAGRFVFGSGGEPSSNDPSQLASQGALGMDDTKMDLSQFDESGGKALPTTPVRRSPATVSQEAPVVIEAPLDLEASPEPADEAIVGTEEMSQDAAPEEHQTTAPAGHSTTVVELSTDSTEKASPEVPPPIVEEPKTPPPEETAEKTEESPTPSHKQDTSNVSVEEITESETDVGQAETSQQESEKTVKRTSRTPIVWTESPSSQSQSSTASSVPSLLEVKTHPVIQQQQQSPIYQRTGRSLQRGNTRGRMRGYSRTSRGGGPFRSAYHQKF